MTRLEQQIQFLVEIDKVKNIFRQTYLADGNRKENDAEHSWHIALMAFLLKEHVEEPVDVMKVIIMVLIHDLVEIDAETLMRMMQQGQLISVRGKKKRQTVFLACFQKIRGYILENYGKNLRLTRLPMQSMHIC